MKETPALSRRHFLKNTGMLVIGFSMFSRCTSGGEEAPPAYGEPPESLPGSLREHPRIDSWLQVLEDGRVRVFTGKIELGQGIRIAIAQVAAEELNTPPERIEVHLAETDMTPNEGYTAGSRSIEQSAMSVRYAAAAANQQLRELAAEKLRARADQLALDDGKVRVLGNGAAMTFAEVLEGRQLEGEVPADVRPKAKEAYQWVGKPVSRNDLDEITRGKPLYVQDLRFPDMVHARVIHPAGYGARLLDFDEAGLRNSVDGILKIVRDGSFLAVITETEYQAVKAQRYLRDNATWSTPNSLPAGQDLEEYLRGLPTQSQQVEDKGSFDESAEIIKSSYFKPYVMHGAMGPSCAVARFEDDRLQVWSHSQGVYPLRNSMQELVGLPLENIHIKGVPGAGCYGHNGADDVAAEAALLAKAFPGRHVRLQWSRFDEHGWEPYGSAMIMETEASLDDEGRISQWRYNVWSDTHSTRPGGDPARLLPALYLKDPFSTDARGYFGGAYRNGPPYYDIPNIRIDAHGFEGPLRVSALRSLGAYANIFAIESFMDELAERAGKDPLEFRLMHADDERSRAILEKLQEMTAGQSTGADEGIGYAFARYKNSASYCGVAVKLRVNPDEGQVQLQGMWAAIDAGEVINPDGLRNQTEGGMVQSASWTLREEVKFDRQHVSSLDWASYPIFTMQDTPPEIEVAVIDRPEEPALGAGEAAQGPTSAAIANAVYRASGQRVRRLPIRMTG